MTTVFISHSSKDKEIKILAENVQIQNEKTTVGEIDCILTTAKKPVHLEIIYKFYLYDKSVGTNELEHWIGPNRRDSLVSKLNKLKDKQLPLLYNLFWSNNKSIAISTIFQPQTSTNCFTCACFA